jgi:DNA polymerase-3 subunit alpha
VAYQTAWLKANYPVEFLSAMMTNDQGDTAKLSQYIAEAKLFGIETLGPDINASGLHFAPAAAEEGRRVIRFGLAAIKGVGEAAVEALLAARSLGGAFINLEDLCGRVETKAINRKALESLIKAGACDSVGPNRATVFHQIDGSMARATANASDKSRGQVSFFDTFEAAPAARQRVEHPVVQEDWPVAQKLADEKELVGFYVSGHPLGPYEKLLSRHTTHTIEELAALPNRSMIRIGGLVSAVQKGVSKKTGKPYAMVTLEDLTGTVTLLAMNESYDKFRELFVANLPLMVVGEVATGEDKPKIFPTDIFRLEEAPRRLTKQVQLRIASTSVTRERLESVRGILQTHGGRVPFYLCVQMPSGVSVYIEPNDRFTVSPSVELEEALESVCGPLTVFMSADKSLPERQLRKWEKKNDGGGGEE